MKTGLLLIDHGSKYPQANDTLNHIQDLVQSIRPSLIIEVAHMELAEPTIADGVKALVEKGVDNIVAVPYMLAPGRHASRDIPNLVYKEKDTYPDVTFNVTGPLGIHQKLAEIVLEKANL